LTVLSDTPMPNGWRKAYRDVPGVGRKFWQGGATYTFCRCASCQRNRARAKHASGEFPQGREDQAQSCEVEQCIVGTATPHFGKAWAEKSKHLDWVQYAQRQGAKKSDYGCTKSDRSSQRHEARAQVRLEVKEERLPWVWALGLRDPYATDDLDAFAERALPDAEYTPEVKLKECDEEVAGWVYLGEDEYAEEEAPVFVESPALVGNRTWASVVGCC